MKNYNFVFWGNINIHVYPLAESLSRISEVTIIYDSRTFSNRKERQISYKESATLFLIDMANNDLYLIIKKFIGKKYIHINTALKNSNTFDHKVLLLLLKEGECVISLPQEGFNFLGVKQIVNRLKWYYYINVRYRKIRCFGLTGINAFKDFRDIGCPKKKLFPFIYVTNPYENEIELVHKTERIKMIFVGAIDERKNICNIIRFINRNTTSLCAIFELHIYGGYGNEELLKEAIGNNELIYYHGIVPNMEVRKAMLTSDIVILPSKYDGWGAVINEALQCGCRVLVSNKCGSSAMPIAFPELRCVFDPDIESDFLNKLNNLLCKGKLLDSSRKEIKDWSDKHIHPNVVANYLINVIDTLENEKQLPKNIFWSV